jgi:hypothetical protein
MVRHGSALCHLALGILGGGELNHSSDVDLLFLYDEEGQLTARISHHEFFNQLAKETSWKRFLRPIASVPFFASICAMRREGFAGPLSALWRVWKIITPGSAKPGNALHESKRAASPVAASCHDFLRSTSAIHHLNIDT